MTVLIIIGIIYLIGFCWLRHEIKNAPEVPKDLEDLF